MGCTDVEQNIVCLTTICCGLLGVLKITWFRIYANSIINNYDSVLNDYLTIDNIKERAIMRKHAFIGRILCYFLLGFSYFSCLMYAIIPFLDYEQDNRINITNRDTTLNYTVLIPSKCSLEYLNFSPSMHKISCLVEAFIMIMGTSANPGNIYLIV